MKPARVVDSLLEASIIGSFSKIGASTRGRLAGWETSGIDADLRGQRALVTGGSSGIGRAAAHGLLELGADVIVTSRDQTRADAVADDLGDHALGMALDTGELDSVRVVARSVAELGPLDIVLHNAGALSEDYRTNSAGMEQTLASHLVGPYLLTRALRPSLTRGARVLWMSSGGMYTQRLDLDTLEARPDRYRGAIAYAKAKRAQVELVTHLGPLWAPDVLMHSLHPGWVDTPGVDASLPGFATIMGPVLRTPEQGADTMVWLAATGGGPEARPGCFWLDRRPRRTSYLPGTAATTRRRQALVDWLDSEI